MDDRVFAILPAARSGNTPTSDDEVEDIGMMAGNRLVALNREDGRPLWATPSRSIKLDNKGVPSFAGASDRHPPRRVRDGPERSAKAPSISSTSSASIPTQAHPPGAATSAAPPPAFITAPGQDFGNIPIPTLVDDVLYVATGQGATCAVDANVGRILWLQMSAKKRNPLRITTTPKSPPPGNSIRRSSTRTPSSPTNPVAKKIPSPSTTGGPESSSALSPPKILSVPFRRSHGGNH